MPNEWVYRESIIELSIYISQNVLMEIKFKALSDIIKWQITSYQKHKIDDLNNFQYIMIDSI